MIRVLRPYARFVWDAAFAAAFIEPVRAVLSMGSIAVAVALMLVFEGFQSGLDHQLASVPSQLPAELVALQPGMANFIGPRSVLPQNVRAEVEAVPGVRVADPLVSVPVIYERNGRRTPITVIGYDTAGGPQHVVAGKPISAARELVVDSVLASKHRLKVGDTVEVLGEDWTIAGLSAETATMFTPYVFARYDDLVDLYLSGDLGDDFAEEPPLLSFLLVRIAPGFAVEQVRAAIESEVDRVDVRSPGELARGDVALGRRLIGPILQVMIVIAWLGGALVVGIAGYTTVEHRRRELGVMKAIGTPSRLLVAALAAEMLTTTTVAFGLAVLLAELVGRLVGSVSPEYLVLITEPGVVLRTIGITLIAACLGITIPVQAVARIDPALAFRS